MFLNVVNKRGGWSADEDELLLEAHRKFGNRWTEIAKKLPGRTDNAVKNRFCVLCKRQTKEVQISLQKPSDSGSDTAKQQLSERRLLDEPKATPGSGANKKMRTEANHKRKPGVGVPKRSLEETLQQWKGLQPSEGLTCPPHQVSIEERLPPWDFVESNEPHRNRQADKLQGWMGLAVEGRGSSTQSRMQPRETFSQWDGSQSDAGINDSNCSTSSLLGEARPFDGQSQVLSVGSPCQSRLTQENLQQWKREDLGDGTGVHPHYEKMCKTSHSSWTTAKVTTAANGLLPQQKSDNELLRWWKGFDKSMMSKVALQHKEFHEGIPHCEQNPHDCITASLNEQRSIDKELPPLSEMSSVPAAYLSNSKNCTLISGMQRCLMVRTGNPDDHVQQSNEGRTQIWDTLAKEANANTADTESNENMHEWQDWKSTETENYYLGRDRPIEYTMEIDSPISNDSAEGIALEASVKSLCVWTGPNCQHLPGKTMMQGPDGHEAQEWKKSEVPTKSPRQLLEDGLQQLENSQTAVHPAPLVSMLSRFAGIESKSFAHLLRASGETQGRDKSQFIEESWKTAVQKLKRRHATFSSNSKTQSPRQVLGFEEYMSGGSQDIDLKIAAEFRHAITNLSRTPMADDSRWESPINVKAGEDGEMNNREGLLPENRTTCEASPDVCGVPNDEGILQICLYPRRSLGRGDVS